jgi:beta-phosphoglucomutase-like phosphatase (HAD superfamily)
MKRFFILVAAVAALTLVGCTESDYAKRGKEMAAQLDQAVEKQDNDAALDVDKAIREAEQEIMALNDSAAIADFREALRESRQRNTPFLTKIKVESGVDREEAVKEVTQDVMNGDVNIQAVTASIDSLLKVEEQQKKK